MLGFPASFLQLVLFLSASGVVQHTVASAADGDKEARCKACSDGPFRWGDCTRKARTLLCGRDAGAPLSRGSAGIGH